MDLVVDRRMKKLRIRSGVAQGALNLSQGARPAKIGHRPQPTLPSEVVPTAHRSDVRMLV
jgi:hypothetical protein